MKVDPVMEIMELKAQVNDLSDIMAEQENEISDLKAQNYQLKRIIRFLVNDSEFVHEAKKLKDEGLQQASIAKAMGFLSLSEYRRRLHNALNTQREEHAL